MVTGVIQACYRDIIIKYWESFLYVGLVSLCEGVKRKTDNQQSTISTILQIYSMFLDCLQFAVLTGRAMFAGAVPAMGEEFCLNRLPRW